jgi:ketosteroid isomerase-like protein
MPILNGKDAIKTALKELVADPNFSLQFSSTKVEASKAGDLIYTQGTYTMTMSADPKNPKSKPVSDKGKYLTIFQKQADGKFKAIEDIENSDLSPAAPPAK